MDQIGIIPSGIQKWYKNVLTIGNEYLVYSSTLSLYVYRLSDFVLDRILCGHTQSVTGIKLSPNDDNLLATASLDQTIRVWDLSSGKEVKLLSTTGGKSGFQPLFLDWSPYEKYSLMCGGIKGYVRVYNYQTEKFSAMYMKNDSKVKICKYSPNRSNRAVAILENNNILVFDPRTEGVKKVGQIITKYKSIKQKIIDVQLDPLSNNYFLVLCAGGELHLFDMNSPSKEYFKLNSFSKVIGTCIAWIRDEPGDFLIADARSGVIRKYNVSQNAPKEVFRVRNCGFRRIIFSKRDRNLLAVSFVDGSAGVYDYKLRKTEFLTEPGHIETIFGCEYCRVNPDIFATSSYDSRIKLWDTRTMRLLGDLLAQDSQKPDETTIIYSVAWHPSKYLLAGSLGNGMVWIWDARVGKRYPVHKHKLHAGPVYRVVWNTLNETLCATSSKDHCAMVFKWESGKVQKVYRHPKPVFGICWSPHSKDLLVTGCYDHNIRIFNVSSKSTLAVRKLVGHTQQVYNVVWHPILANLILSGSNDDTVRVWNVSEKAGAAASCRIMKGHSNNVRALAWNAELPFLCLSGSWDGTIRVWDTRREGGKCCLKVVTDHHADVYGLSSHPWRPFVYGSTSRDSTIRFWSLEPMLREIFIKSILDVGFENIVEKATVNTVDVLPKTKKKGGGKTVDEGQDVLRDAKLLSNSKSGKVKLCGKRSKEIESFLVNLGTGGGGGGSSVLFEKYFRIIDFLYFPYGLKDLFSLVFQILQIDAIGGFGKWMRMSGKEKDKFMSKLEPESGLEEEEAFYSKEMMKRTTSTAPYLLGNVFGDDIYARLFDHGEGEGQRKGGGVHSSLLVCQISEKAKKLRGVYSKNNENEDEEEEEEEEEEGQKKKNKKKKKKKINLGQIGMRKKEDVLKEVGEMYLSIGNMRKYVEVLVELGEWEKAISLAPAVSVEYWKELCMDYAFLLRCKGENYMDPNAFYGAGGVGSDKCIPYYLSVGRTNSALEFMIERKEYKRASILAGSEHTFQVQNQHRSARRKQVQKEIEEEVQKRMKEFDAVEEEINEEVDLMKSRTLRDGRRNYVKKLSFYESHRFFAQGRSFHSSCVFLKNNFFTEAIRSCIKGNEILMGYILAKLLNFQEDYELNDIFVRLTREGFFSLMLDSDGEYIGGNMSSLKKELFGMLERISNMDKKIECVCHFAQFVKKKEDLHELYSQSGFETPLFYEKEAEHASSVSEQIQYLCLGKKFNDAVKLALSEFENLFASSTSKKKEDGKVEEEEEDWNWEEILKIHSASKCINLLNGEISKEDRLEILGFMNFVAGQLAVWKQYYELAPFFFLNCRGLFQAIKTQRERDAQKRKCWCINKDLVNYNVCFSVSLYDLPKAKKYLQDMIEKNVIDPSSIKVVDALSKLKKKVALKIKEEKGILGGGAPKRTYLKNAMVTNHGALPTKNRNGTREKSLFTGKEINCPIVKIHKKKFVSFGEALMWVNLMPFSPTNTGEILKM